MPVGLKVEIDIRPALAMARVLSENAVRAAWRRALKKTGKWVKTYVAKGVSREVKIPQKVLRERLYFFLRSKMMEGKVWLGANPIEAHRIGTPRQTRRGVTVGRLRFDGAWIYRSKHSSSKDGKVFRRVGAARAPFEMVRYEWDEVGQRVFQEVAGRAEERMMLILEQELNYEIHKLRDGHG